MVCSPDSRRRSDARPAIVPAGASKEAIEKAALDSETFISLAQGTAVKRVIVVPGRLVNVVI